MNSKSFSLNKADVVALLKNALLVSGAAGLTYVAESVGKLDLGPAGALLVPVVVLGLDSLIRWVRDNTKK